MKNLLILLTITGGGWMYLKSHMNQPPETTPAVAASTALPRAPMPMVNGVPSGSREPREETAAAKFGDLTVPPELLRFVSPALLTTTPSGTQDLSPAAKFVLRQLIDRARADPAAFKEQLASMSRTLGAPR